LWPRRICWGCRPGGRGKLAEQLGIKQLSKSQVSEMAAHLDAQVEAFRNRPLDSGHYLFVWLDVLVIKVREHGRTVNVHALVAVGSTPTAAARCWAWTSPAMRTAPAGSPSSAR
jgi:Transposase, Mutator family